MTPRGKRLLKALRKQGLKINDFTEFLAEQHPELLPSTKRPNRRRKERPILFFGHNTAPR